MSKEQDSVLGIFVSDSSLEGVLLRKSADDKVHVVDRLTRQRIRKGERVGDLAAVIPGLRDSSESDFTLEVGSGSNGSSGMFLPGELESLGAKKAGELASKEGRGPRDLAPFGLQLREMLADCKARGHVHPKIGFCLGATDVVYSEVTIPVSKGDSKKESKKQSKIAAKTSLSNSDKKVLLQKVADSIAQDFDKTRVAFIPMTSSERHRRFLAVVPLNPDPVVEALEAVARRHKGSVPPTHVVDGEISMLVSLVQKVSKVKKGVVGVVRVSSHDTVVLFLKDGVLDQYELLRSLTSYDPVDTVCSRVLLKQDELRIGKVDEMYVSTEHHGDDAVATFSTFFPHVHGLQDVLTEHDFAQGEKINALRANSLPAVGVALRILENWDKTDRGRQYVNLLPKKRQGSTTKKEALFAWHSYVLMLALFGVALFYTWDFMVQREEIARKQEEIRLNPPQFPTEDPALLRMRVDSLNLAYAGYTRSLYLLDSLLVGSDKWSNTLDDMSKSTRDIGRVWIKAWTPQGNSLRLEGNALSRSRIAELALRWNGSIEQLNFAEIQKIRVYTFLMNVPVENKLPDVAVFLRENGLDDLSPEDAEALEGMSQAAHSHN